MSSTTTPQRRLGIYGVLLIVLALVAAPLASVLVNAAVGYHDEPSALGSIVQPGMLHILGNTILLSVLVVAFATLMAAPLAFLRSWTRFSRANWIEIVIMIPFMTPPFAAAMAWMDFTRRGGVAEMLLGHGAGKLAHDAIYSVWGMAFIMAAELFPFLYLILRTCLNSIPASTLEMAQIAGASRWQQAVRIIAPNIIGPFSLGALIIFIKAAGEFGTPVTLGNAIGYKVLVSSIYEDVTIFGAVVTATLFMAAVVIPYLSITLAAMTILRSAPPTPNNLTFDYFSIVVQMPTAQEALVRSIGLGALGATTAVALGVLVTVLTRRQSTITAKFSDFLAIAPDTVPGIVLAIGFILLWNSPWLPWSPYGTMGMLVMAFTVLFLPMAIQNIKASAESVSPTVYEAAAISGSSTLHTFGRITLPLLAPGIFAGWLLAFFVGIRELVMSSLIRPSQVNLLAPWIMNQFDQGHRAEAMAMTLIGVGTSTVVLVAITWWQNRKAAHAR